MRKVRGASSNTWFLSCMVTGSQENKSLKDEYTLKEVTAHTIDYLLDAMPFFFPINSILVLSSTHPSKMVPQLRS